jgi:ribonucleotide reductase alpha subunit
MHSMHFYAWKNGLKTGQYYFRSRPARDAIKFTVNVDMLLKASDNGSAQVMEVLNSDNAQANIARKKKRTTSDKPEAAKRPVEEKTAVLTETNAEMKNEESDDSYVFEPACENCSG